ncbi:heme biosynthesis protein HemY [Paracoccus sp. Z118]|uniref:heme biosynthesis protein HemY n=1 Tax=Paracoccus sp. Z118 TaxID=2851017 RepID=UPI001C2B8CF3|nr:heme biosynthesis HemY N-terminal domain-containing protein [Paracoccus sp. Z118]MBV0891760.1 heme biosynthesis protein HemY [Paracoccus sp. Z118]
MLLSLLKILLFFSVVLAGALAVMRLAEADQVLRVVFNGVEYTLGPVQIIVLALLVVLAGWLTVQLLRLAIAFLRFLAGDRTAIDRHFARKRERKGYQAVADGMLAVASGEGKLAQDKARKAAKYLDQPHVTNLLAAQAAEVAGDTARAEVAYRTMLTDPRTRFVAVRGLMQQRLAAGDTQTALQLAQKAYALRPSHTELQDTLLTLQTREHDWKGARSVLKDKRRQGALPQDVALRRDAVLALQEAREVLAHGNSISAREAAISANRASPDLVPAAVLAARSYLAKKDTRNATRVLQKTWSVQPHPSVAAAYAEIVPDETPVQRLRRFEDLIKQAPTHEESRLLQAELMLAAEDFPGARRAIGDIAEKHPTVRSLSIMAAIERGEGAEDSVVRAWLARAMTASRGPQWVCDKCHNVMTDWAPVCDSCGGFDTLTWREPPMDLRLAGTAGNTVTMLPLLVARESHGDHAPSDHTDASMAPRPAGPAPAPAPKAKAARVVEVAHVAPGMVPRESDYEPSMTVTDPELDIPAPPATVHIVGKPDSPAKPVAAAGPVVVSIRQAPDPFVRPDVEPQDERTARKGD